MAQPQLSWIGHTIGGRYKIEALLGQGGMSTVYKATDPNLRRAVAVKIIHSHLSVDPEFVRRFEQEAAAVAQLRHPNIIQVYDFDHEGDVYYMVLEYVPGQTLQVKLKALNAAGQKLPPAETIQIMATISDAVAYAHQRGMIHRDLKPANVMLNPAGQPILMDFGVAKMLGGTHHTATGDVIGTVSYMAPEQARGEHPDERADIYALGVMLFEMTTGQRPFEADTAVSLMMKHLMEPVPDILQINSDAPKPLVTVIERALAKSPADRYQSAADMATALRAAMKMHEQIGARAYTAPIAPAPEPAPAMDTAVARPAQPPRTAARRRLPLLLGGAAAIAAILAALLLVIIPQFSGPALPSADGMSRIDGGVYLVGLDASDDEHAPSQQVTLDTFWIDQHEVTNEQYAEFLAATPGQPPANWSAGSFPAGQERHPVQGVTWEQAAAYCEWANKRLPSEAEWEIAARGREGLLYPWGDDVRAVESQLPRRETYAVGQVADNRSRFGAFDMAGNVWEWVDDTYAPVTDGFRVLRGGANGFLKDMAYRLQGDPNLPSMIATAGFRCAAPRVSGDVARADTPAPATPVQPAEGVLFHDDFTDPSSGWPAGEQGNYTFGYHPQSFYHLEVSASNDRLTIFRDLHFDDFSAETEVLVDHTDTDGGEFRYGLAFRRSGNEYYAFTVSPRSQTWQVIQSSPGGVEVLEEGPAGPLRGLQKAPDRLRVDADGANFTFYVNGEIVTRVSDADYATGEVGFIVETDDETLAHVHYSSLTIRQAGAQATLFADDFVDLSSGWPITEQDKLFFGYHPPDFYHVEVSAPDTRSTVFRDLNFADFTAETKVLVDHTDTDSGDFRYGLAFRRSDSQYYAFAVSPRAQTWQVLKQSAQSLQVLAEGVADSLQGLQKVGDQLRVDAGGSNFVFHINGAVVARVSDSDFAGGEIGFIVETFDETLAHVHYDSLTIREVDLAEVVIAPTDTAAPTTTPTAAAAPTPTPIPVPEGMALIPAGYFQMGSSIGQANEAPEHPVLLDAFYMDLYEVTNAQYRACVDAGGCAQGRARNSFTHAGYRDDSAYDNYPVIGVTWDMAAAYCSWASKRLPTEAEWEYAASGQQNFFWPWGNTFDANLSAASAPDVQPVSSYPGGVSPFGMFDIAGNVTEWVADVYDPAFYANSPASNPVNTSSGDTRIYRGGSFDNRDGTVYTTSRRFIQNRAFSDVDVGFRCARDATEVNASAQPAEREALVAEFCQVFSAYRPDATCP